MRERRRWTRFASLAAAAAVAVAVAVPVLASVPSRTWDTSMSLHIPAGAPAGQRWWATVDGSIALSAPAGWVICEWRIVSNTFGGTEHWTYHYRADKTYIVRFGLNPFSESVPGTQAYNMTFEPAPLFAWTVTADGSGDQYYWVDYVVISQNDCSINQQKEEWRFKRPTTAWGGTTAGPDNPDASLEPGTATQPTQPLDWAKAIFDLIANPPAPPAPPGPPTWQPWQPPAPPATMVPPPQHTPRAEQPVVVPQVPQLPVPPPVPAPPPLPPLPPVVDKPFGDVVDPVQSADPVVEPDPPLAADPPVAPDPVQPADPPGVPDPVQPTDPPAAPDPVMQPDPPAAPDPVVAPDPVTPPDPPAAPDPVQQPDPVQPPDPVPAPDQPMQPDPPPPGQPQGLIATVGPGSCSLSWQPVERATEYRVYRDFGEEPVAVVAGTGWTDTGLVAGVEVVYQVAAYDAATGKEGARSWAVSCVPQ